MISFQKIIRKIHLWLGVTCGIIASFSGLTGSLYVWQPEITALLNPELLRVENIEQINDSIILNSASTLIEAHNDSINKVFLPYREQKTISLLFNNGKTHYYHPLNNTFLGEKSTSIKFFENLLSVHRTLGIPKFGKYIIGTSAVVFFLLLLTSGIYIWWKIYARKLRKGFRIKWKSKKRKFNFDLHKVLGIYFITPLFVISFTGAYFTYNTTYKEALKLFDKREQVSDYSEKSIINESLTLNEYLLDQNNDYAIRAIYFPQEKTDGYKIRYIKDRFIQPGFRKTKEVVLKANGIVTTSSDYDTDANSLRIAAQFYPIHIGEIMGLTGRLLVFISGFIPLILFVTGLRIFLSKKK